MGKDFFALLKQELTEYGKSLGQYGQLRLIGIISRVLGMFLLILTVVLCGLALFTFAAIAVIDILSNYMPVWAAALIIGSTYIVLIIMAFVCRQKWFINPFIKMLSEQIKTEEELILKTAEAEHQAEIQRVRMECHIENATREITFYTGLITRIWESLKRLFHKS
jgi:hypothetical protein